ncbi:hypothetical protein ACROYT_G008842 [Oculina patagonica]
MKFVAVAVFVALILAVSVDSASVSLSSSQLTLNGNAHIQFYGPREAVWAGLSDGHRYPIINSGDLIALRLAYTSGTYAPYWFFCGTGACLFRKCHGTVMQSSSWSSCSSDMIFKITAMNKMDGQPINSGDTVIFTNKATGLTSALHLRCDVSSSWKCRMYSTTKSMTGNNWMYYGYSTFQIFSRNAVDGTPVQYGDIVGLKYPFGGYTAWLKRSGSYFYSNSCSYNNKASCAAVNSYTGFQIFKQL